MGILNKVTSILEWLARLAGPLADLLRAMDRFASFVLEARSPGPIGATA